MIVLDTSALLAALDAGQRHHERARQVLASDPGPLLLSPFVLAELDYLLLNRVGEQAERALLDEVAGGAYDLVPFGAGEVAEAADLIGRYVELRIGLADARSRSSRPGRGRPGCSPLTSATSARCTRSGAMGSPCCRPTSPSAVAMWSARANRSPEAGGAA